MKTRLIVPAVLAALTLTSPAFAAGGSTTCDALIKQFDKVDPYHTANGVSDALVRADRTAGENLCIAGKTEEGEKMIRGALNAWGVKPKA